MKLGQKGLKLIRDFEGFVPYVYDDKVPPKKGVYTRYKEGDPIKGTLTCLVGHTDSAHHPLKIKDAIGKTYTEKFGLEVLDVDLDECEDAVNNLVKVGLSQGQFDALVSFTFNCGTGNLRKLIVPLNKKDYNACCSKFGEFTRSKGEVMTGLIRRRRAEQSLFNDPYNVKKPQQEVEPIPKVTPVDAPSAFEKVIKSKTVWAGAATAGTPILSAVSDWKILAVFLAACLLAFIIYERVHRV